MRTLTATHTAVYASAYSARASWAKVEVYSTITSTWIEITDYLGYNWVTSVELAESLDNCIQTATIGVALLGGPQGELTSSPFVSGGLFSFGTGYVAYGALLSPYKQIRVSLAVTPIDVEPSSSDWMLKFRGRIQKVSVSPTGVTLTCRDEMGDLADAFIEDERFYGSDTSTVTSQSVMQSILNDWGGSVVVWSPTGTGGTPFAVADSPGWNMKQLRFQRASVMDTIKKIADQVCYDLRFKWQTSAADLKLVMSAPTRTSPPVLRTFSLGELNDLNISLSTDNIRNVIRVGYYQTSQNHYTVTAPSPATSTSITNYGRRWMEIGEEPTSYIDTSTEATNMANRTLADLELLKAQIEATMPLFPNAELSDYYTFTGDDKMMATVSLAVTQIVHRVDGNEGTTSFVATSNPAHRTMLSQRAKQILPTSTKLGVINSKVSSIMANGDFSQWSGW
jgi:hypothetical protein